MSGSGRLSTQEALDRLTETPGDEEAWNAIYRRLWPFVFSITIRLLDASAAEDAAQDAFMRTAERFPFNQALNEKVFVVYIATVARRVAIDTVRKRLRSREVSLDEAAEAYEPISADAQAELDTTVRWLMGQLTASDMELTQKLLTHGPNSIATIAKELDVPYGTAGVRLHRLRGRLRRLLAPEKKR
jgi:RNA polymerase sigma factor (sigma-70 family)